MRFLVFMGLGIMLVASSGLPPSPFAFASPQNNTTEPQQTQGMSTSTNTTTGTNIVLVHGAWADGSSWTKVIPILKNSGHRVIAVQLPLHSVADEGFYLEFALLIVKNHLRS
jgi:pimeloyl-ACP methyl ester carboxylesterase